MVINKSLTGLLTKNGINNIVIGSGAGTKTAGDSNLQSASRMVIIGDGAAISDNNGSSPSDGVYIGYKAGGVVGTANPNNDVMIGSYAGSGSTSIVSRSNSKNTAIGGLTGIARSNSNNTVIGYNARAYNGLGIGDYTNAGGISYVTVIGAEAEGNVANHVFLGRKNKDDVQVGRLLKLADTATNPAGVNGALVYNSTVGKTQVYEEGRWKNMVQDFVSGKTILVDVANPQATDDRGNLSKYNINFPFKSIKAAVAVVAAGDNLKVQNGTYNERIADSEYPSWPVNTVVTVENATILSWKLGNNGTHITGIGNANIDTLGYHLACHYSNLHKIKVLHNMSGTSGAVFRNIYSIDSLNTSGGGTVTEFYNINNIRTARVGPVSRFFNCRFVNDGANGNGTAIRPYSSVVSNVNDVAFVKCYIEGSTYAIEVVGVGTKFKILDSEVYGGTAAIALTGSNLSNTTQMRLMNTLLRSATGNATIQNAFSNRVMNLELSNTTRSGDTQSSGTVTYLLRNNDVIYPNL